MMNQTFKRGPRLGRFAIAGMVSAVLMACASTVPPSADKARTADGPERPVGGHGHAAFMGSYDANRDGVVTRDEYDTVRKQRFAAADTNHDGWLSEDEYVAEFEGRLKQQYANRPHDESYANSMKQAHVRFKILDTDHDGRLTVEEEIAIADKTFKRTDANGDGRIDAADGEK